MRVEREKVPPPWEEGEGEERRGRRWIERMMVLCTVWKKSPGPRVDLSSVQSSSHLLCPTPKFRLHERSSSELGNPPCSLSFSPSAILIDKGEGW